MMTLHTTTDHQRETSFKNVRNLFVVALALTILMFGLLGWGAFYSYSQAKRFKEKDIRVEELRGMIMYLDEVLTMSARMAVLTGEPRWEKRYRDFEPMLREAIRESTRLAEGIAGVKMAQATSGAYQQLTDMNNHAFDLLHAAQGNQAREILFSQDYKD